MKPAIQTIIAVLLMILLPLQAAWSVAALWCQHENSAQWHWGHHGHVSDASCQSTRSQVAVSEASDSSAQSDNSSKIPSSDTTDNDKAGNDKTTNNQTTNNQISSDKKSPSYPFGVMNHSDHINTSPLGLYSPLQTLLLPRYALDYAVIVEALPLNFYQSPVLEQPKPPRWSA